MRTAFRWHHHQNFVVSDGDSKFVARICEERRFLGIDRLNEKLCQEAAHAADVVHFENGILVSEFVEATTFANANLQDSSTLGRVAETIRQLHNARQQLTGELLFFCPFQTVRTYTATAREIAAPLPNDIDEFLNDSAKLATQLAPYHPALCHNDLLAANIMDDGDKIWLVDWEYAGIGNPLFDLSSIAANCELDADHERHLIECYFGSIPVGIMRDLQILKIVSLLREALWAVIQSIKSEIEFDYIEYANNNFEAYKQARAEL